MNADLQNLALSMLKTDIENQVPMPNGTIAHFQQIATALQGGLMSTMTVSKMTTSPQAEDRPVQAFAPELPERPARPAVPVENSITEEGKFLICLEDGTQHVMLKRYLRRRYNMTPEQYRLRWNLPSTYPMVSPSYSRLKSQAAFSMGFGTIEARIRENRHQAA
ncbi:MucR family transcriptional regulator [Gluconobacter potus]|uniref:MucR family transcriptional regulator n=1 Tax=Gluconobacter potus TaxID=2724927 RepID=UPI0007801EE2|nr:MucR family transcriptional regulator [Gluconobacter potus]